MKNPVDCLGHGVRAFPIGPGRKGRGEQKMGRPKLRGGLQAELGYGRQPRFRVFNDASGGIWSLDPGGAAGPGVKSHWHRARRYGPVGMTQILGPIGIVTGSPTRTPEDCQWEFNDDHIGSGAMDSSSDIVDEILHAPPGDEPDSQTQF